MSKHRSLGRRTWEIREETYKEYRKQKKDTCERCGCTDGAVRDEDGFLLRKGRPLTVHHIDGNVGNNDPENLMTLCRRCHDIVETA